MNLSQKLICFDSNNILTIFSPSIDNKFKKVLQCDFQIKSLNDFLISNCENYIIIASNNQIFFYKLENQKFILIQTIQCQSNVRSLCLSNSNNKLISYEEDQLIRVYEKFDNKWQTAQTIEIELECNNFCFLYDNSFVLLASESYESIFYCLKLDKKQFIRTSNLNILDDEVDCDGSCFPMQFIQEKNLLLVKLSKHIFILENLNNEKFNLVQQISFQSYILFGGLSKDGKFLITWDNGSKEYQLRKLKEE